MMSWVPISSHMPPDSPTEEALTSSIVGTFYSVYNEMGYGYSESVYANALTEELRARGHRVAREVRIVVRYKGVAVGVQRLDMVVDDVVVVENKASERIPQAAIDQLVSY